MKMLQYQIRPDFTQEQMKWVYRKFLKKDSLFHFFHEGDHCLIRTAGVNVGLEKWLKRKKINFNCRPYEDPHSYVLRHQDIFIPMFHSFTLLGLEYGNDEKLAGDWNRVYDRVTHCFCNMSGLLPQQELSRGASTLFGRMMYSTVYEAMGQFESRLVKILQAHMGDVMAHKEK